MKSYENKESDLKEMNRWMERNHTHHWKLPLTFNLDTNKLEAQKHQPPHYSILKLIQIRHCVIMSVNRSQTLNAPWNDVFIDRRNNSFIALHDHIALIVFLWNLLLKV